VKGRNNRISISDRHSYIYSFRKQGVYLLKPQDTIIRYMSFPKMKRKELEEAIVTEYLSYAAIAGGTPDINWEIIDETNDYVRVLAIGIKKEHLNEIYTEVKKESGVKLFAAVVLVGVVAELVKDLSEEKDFGVVFVGDNQSDLIFYKNGKPIYGRNINIGHRDMITDVGFSERDITDFLSNIDEAIIRNFPNPVKVFVASITRDDPTIIEALRRYSSYEIESFSSLMSIAAEDTHEAVLRAAWNLGVSGHPMYVFVPELYKEEQRVARRVFYTTIVLIATILFGLGSINLTYQNLLALKLEQETKQRQLMILNEEISKLLPYEEEYNRLLKQREALGKLAFIENNPHRYWQYYVELGRLIFGNRGTLISINGTSSMLQVTVKFYQEEDMLRALSAFKSSNLFQRVIVYSTSKTADKKTNVFLLNIGVSLK